MGEKLYDVELLVWSYNDDDFRVVFRKNGLTADEAIAFIVGEHPNNLGAWRGREHQEEEDE